MFIPPCVFLLTKIIHLTTLRELVNNYVDIQLSRQELIQTLEDNQTDKPEYMDGPKLTYKTVPVSISKNGGFEYAKVSVEDYPRIVGLSPTWRKSSSGYAIHVKKPEIDGAPISTTYMHKIVFGSQAKHINGDRLDNRRENLVLSTRKRKYPVPLKEEFVLHTPRFMTFEACTYDENDPDLKHINGYAIVKFGEKTYSGEVRNGEPCGYGMITQNQDPYDMCGIWSKGKLETGIITYYKPLPLAMDNEARLVTPREVTKVEVISNGNKLSP